LAQAIFREGSKNVTAGANPMQLKKGIELAVSAITEELKKLSKPVKGKMIAQVGTISANNDETIGQHHRGSDGEGRQGRRHHRRRSEVDGDLARSGRGMQFDRGYLSPYFVTDAERNGSVARERARLIQREEDLQHEGPAARARAGCEAGQPLLLIAEDIEARRWRRSSSTSCVARSRSQPSRLRATATAARPCSKTSPS